MLINGKNYKYNEVKIYFCGEDITHLVKPIKKEPNLLKYNIIEANKGKCKLIE